MATAALVLKRSTPTTLSAGTRSVTGSMASLNNTPKVRNTLLTKDSFTTEDNMRVLNDINGNVNGKVELTPTDVRCILSMFNFINDDRKLEEEKRIERELKALKELFIKNGRRG